MYEHWKISSQKVLKIKTKKHGYKSNRFLRKGLDILREGFRNTSQGFMKIWDEFFKYIYSVDSNTTVSLSILNKNHRVE